MDTQIADKVANRIASFVGGNLGAFSSQVDAPLIIDSYQQTAANTVRVDLEMFVDASLVSSKPRVWFDQYMNMNTLNEIFSRDGLAVDSVALNESYQKKSFVAFYFSINVQHGARKAYAYRGAMKFDPPGDISRAELVQRMQSAVDELPSGNGGLAKIMIQSLGNQEVFKYVNLPMDEGALEEILDILSYNGEYHVPTYQTDNPTYAEIIERGYSPKRLNEIFRAISEMDEMGGMILSTLMAKDWEFEPAFKVARDYPSYSIYENADHLALAYFKELHGATVPLSVVENWVNADRLLKNARASYGVVELPNGMILDAYDKLPSVAYKSVDVPSYRSYKSDIVEIELENVRRDNEMFDIQNTLFKQGVEGEDIDDIGIYLRHNKPRSIFVGEDDLDRALHILETMGYNSSTRSYRSMKADEFILTNNEAQTMSDREVKAMMRDALSNLSFNRDGITSIFLQSVAYGAGVEIYLPEDPDVLESALNIVSLNGQRDHSIDWASETVLGEILEDAYRKEGLSLFKVNILAEDVQDMTEIQRKAFIAMADPGYIQEAAKRVYDGDYAYFDDDTELGNAYIRWLERNDANPSQVRLYMEDFGLAVSDAKIDWATYEFEDGSHIVPSDHMQVYF